MELKPCPFQMYSSLPSHLPPALQCALKNNSRETWAERNSYCRVPALVRDLNSKRTVK